MRLYTFEIGGKPHIGVELSGQLFDLTVHSSTNPAFLDMLSFLGAGADALNAARQVMANGEHQPLLRFDQVRLLAPIPRPGKVLCSGINYHSHFAENPNAKMPGEPFFFTKLPNAYAGPGQPILAPKVTQQLDYEVEFAVVIGRKLARHTSEQAIMSAIAGYTILNDVSARDVQFKDNQITLGKNFDTFAPMGPCIVTAEELPDVTNVGLRAYVNGRMLQNGSTSDWVFPLPRLIGALLQVMTLEVGDVISTGTPAGVGYFQKPQVFMKPGDVVALEIDGIGRLENPVIAE